MEFGALQLPVTIPKEAYEDFAEPESVNSV